MTGPSDMDLLDSFSSIIETFIPGLSQLIRIASLVVGIDLVSYFFYISFLLAIPVVLNLILLWAVASLKPVFAILISSAEIKHGNNLYPQATMWMSTVHFYSWSRSTIVGLKDGFISFLWDANDDCLESVNTDDQAYYGRVKKVRSTPGQHCLHFFRKDAFDDLMIHIQKVNVDSHRGKVVIKIGHQTKQLVQWQKMCEGPERQLESMALDKSMRNSIISEIKWFFEKDTIDLYKRRGIAHRRGYLFYGAPGTGKTSLCRVIATLFHLSIYIINLTALDDHGLRELFRMLPEPPERCLVLLDDLDAAGITREGSTVKDGSVEKGQGRVTMATLLEVLDGIGAHEYLLVATRNVKPDLDPALTRPGRIDKEYEFKNPDHSTLEEYFNYFFDCRKTGANGLATEFARHVPEGTVTPATIQEHFLKSNDPVTALAKVDELLI
ncbi:hypothetical protein N7540_011032 [Penicillium herquei]|nr:hypothetical protein N7540_011032 [Penicillium herquei]